MAGKLQKLALRLTSAIIVATFAIGASGCTYGTNPTIPDNNIISEPTRDAETAHPVNQTLLAEVQNLMWGGSSWQAQVETNLVNEGRRQEMVAQCMHDKGFEYIVPELAAAFDVNDWRPHDRDWALLWGFGLIVSPAGTPPAVILPLTAEDPNFIRLENVSIAERNAWLDAFGGNNGCQIRVIQEWEDNYGIERLRVNSEFAPLFAAMDELAINLNAEFEAEVTPDWANCMADRGYPFTNTWEPSDQIWNEMATAGFRNWHTAIDSPDLVIPPQLAEIHQREIDLALISLDCREAVNMSGRWDNMLSAAEEQFSQDHRAALLALRSALEQQAPDF